MAQDEAMTERDDKAQRNRALMPTMGVLLEEWRKIDGWPYEASDSGFIRRLGGNIRKNTKSGRYLSIVLSEGKRRKIFLVHTLILTVFIGARPKNHQAAHFDGDGFNNKLSNLRWATAKENHADMERHGRIPFGSKSPHAKIDEKTAIKILKDPLSRFYAAKKYGVSASTISRIRNGKAWRHLPFVKQPKRRVSGPYLAGEKIALGI